MAKKNAESEKIGIITKNMYADFSWNPLTNVIECIGTLSIPEFIQQTISNHMTMETPLLPSGTIYYKIKGNRAILVLELPPGNKSINRRGKQVLWYTPYTQFFFSLSVNNNKYTVTNTKVTFSNTPAKIDTLLCRSVLNNVDNECDVCWGDVTHTKHDSDKSLSSVISQAVNVFFSSRFNGDYTWNFKSVYPDGVKKVSQYLDLAKRDTLKNLVELKWKPFYTMKEILDDIENNY